MHCKLIQPVLIALLALVLSPAYAQEGNSHQEKHIEVALRMIGHQLLLNADDSTSRVLPIIEDEGRYRIQFETEFEFNPDELVQTVNRVVKETEMADSYIVEVEECETKDVVYSFEMTFQKESDIIPCKARDLPRSCYNIVFTLAEQKGTIAGIPNQSSEGSLAEIGRLNYVIGLGVIFLGAFLFFLWQKRAKPVADPNMIAMGDYLFDTRNTELLIEDQKIMLTSKEAELLLLLYKDVNSTITREVILERVWGDEGDYIGRTLDVFISKLRKKLEFDAKVKIVNIRGVGYKLVLDV